MARRPRKTLFSLRVSAVTITQLDELADAASQAAGRRVTRSDVARQILADGIRRARAAARYAARYASDPDIESPAA